MRNAAAKRPAVLLAVVEKAVGILLLLLWVDMRGGTEKQEDNCCANNFNWLHDVASIEAYSSSSHFGLSCVRIIRVCRLRNLIFGTPFIYFEHSQAIGRGAVSPWLKPHRRLDGHSEFTMV